MVTKEYFVDKIWSQDEDLDEEDTNEDEDLGSEDMDGGKDADESSG